MDKASSRLFPYESNIEFHALVLPINKMPEASDTRKAGDLRQFCNRNRCSYLCIDDVWALRNWHVKWIRADRCVGASWWLHVGNCHRKTAVCDKPAAMDTWWSLMIVTSTAKRCLRSRQVNRSAAHIHWQIMMADFWGPYHTYSCRFRVINVRHTAAGHHGSIMTHPNQIDLWHFLV